MLSHRCAASHLQGEVVSLMCIAWHKVLMHLICKCCTLAGLCLRSGACEDRRVCLLMAYASMRVKVSAVIGWQKSTWRGMSRTL